MTDMDQRMHAASAAAYLGVSRSHWAHVRPDPDGHDANGQWWTVATLLHWQSVRPHRPGSQFSGVTVAHARELRAAGATYVEIARTLGVHPRTISRWLAGATKDGSS